MTGTLQNYARKHKFPIDTIEFDYEVRPDIVVHSLGDVYNIEGPDDGCYIFGLYLEGADWDILAKSLNEP